MGLLKHNLAAVCFCALILAAGCGGGQGGSGTSPAGSHTSKVGNAVFTYSGTPKPLLTTSSGSVSVLGQAGATFSGVTLEPPPSLGDTYFATVRAVASESQLYKTMPGNFASAQLLYDGDEFIESPGISAYGVVGFTASNAAGSQLNSIRENGTGLASINFTGLSPISGQYSVDGTNRLTFISGSAVYIGPGTGGTATLVQSNSVSDGSNVWSPTGTKLAYCCPIGSGTNFDIFTTATSGGTPTDVTPTALQNTGYLFPLSWSADGVTILAADVPTTGTAKIVSFSIGNPTSYATITPSGDADNFASFSPDGSMIAIQRSAANGAVPGVYTCDAAGLNQQLVLPDPTGSTSIYGISWSPFLPKETVVATSGSTFYHKAASGFLISENGSHFGSMVAFTANTPADAVIQAPTNVSSGAPLIFTLTADSITSVGYINDYFSTGTTLSLTSTPTVLVTVDGQSGLVDLVAPAATSEPAITKNADGSVTFTASFKAIYDSKGRSLAPSGASKLTLNPRTGRLVSFSI